MANYSDSSASRRENDGFLNEMQEYKAQIIGALNDPDNNINKVFQNEDRSKNAMIMSAMLESCDDITMYCGEMSIFRENFYKHIESKHQGYGDTIKEFVIRGLQNFVETKTNRLNIILENFEKSYLDDLITPLIKDSENINISKVNRDRLLTSVLSHTTIGKKNNEVIIRRRETNSTKHSARCMVNLSEEIANDSVMLMSYIMEASTPIDLKQESL